jgi:hypothetical protein
LSFVIVVSSEDPTLRQKPISFHFILAKILLERRVCNDRSRQGAMTPYSAPQSKVEATQIALRNPIHNISKVAMYITYPSRSKFIAPIEQSVAKERHALMAGHTITIQLEPGGYNRKVSITVNADDSGGFTTDWTGRDPTRFSARLRATAVVLFQGAYTGVFEISHNDGVLEIRRM